MEYNETVNELIKEVEKSDDSVDYLMTLIDSGLLNIDNLTAIRDMWSDITNIPYEYAMLLAEDNLESLVRKVVSDYARCFADKDYIGAMNIHYSNGWMSQVIGAKEYQTLKEIFDNNEELLRNGTFVELFDGVTSYKNLIERYELAVPDIKDYIIKADEYKNLGQYDEMYEAIINGLGYDPCNYELYFSLGEYYLCDHSMANIDKAYLCFENALNYCEQLYTTSNSDDISGDYNQIKDVYDSMRVKVNVRDTLIVIVSYNAEYFLKQNIERIRESLLIDSYKIVVVDNASTDGVYEWLKEQKDILLLRNEENFGFGIACNQGVELAKANGYADYDIFLLNNDTRLADNSLFSLRIGLYEDDQIGAIGSVSNYAGNEQQVGLDLVMPEDYLEYGRKNNIPVANTYEERVRLSGFSMLIRNNAWNEAGGMDELFSPGYFEDDDICMKIRKLGYKLILSNNSFVYHAGSQSFGRLENVNELLMNNYKKFIDKYGFPIVDYAYPNRELVNRIVAGDLEKDINILIYGSRLGADVAYVKALYPNATVYGIEENEKLREYSCCYEWIFANADTLIEYMSNNESSSDIRCIFDYIFINTDSENIDTDVRASLNAFTGLGTAICSYSVTTGVSKINFEGFDKIKLIIWDLDDTFWKGTISEGRATEISDNIKLVKRLVDCGIVNSISSKNDRSVAIERLADMGVADYFVFMDINWEGKGSQIAAKLKAMSLRAENTLFIDDNVNNLEEAMFFSDGIMTATPDIIPKLFEYYNGIEAVDTTHKRLIQYRVLEEKRDKEKSFSSRDEFLRFSRIKVEIHEDCIEQIDRIAEMILRTNQLNYTKKRIDKSKLTMLLNDNIYECRYVTVSDRFGNHGITGFYAVNKNTNELEHLLFSCRIIGMGVEQYIYNILNLPNISIVGEVAVKLEKDRQTPWINITDSELNDTGEGRSQGPADKLLLKGPCDLATMDSMIDYSRIDTEFNYINEKGVVTAGQNHSVHIIESLEMTEEELQELLISAPIVCRGDFETNILDGGYKYICYSLLPDCHTGLYRNKTTGRYVAFGSKNYDITDEKLWTDICLGKIVNHSYPFTKELLTKFSDEWEFVGCTPIDMLVENVDKIYRQLSKATKFILILGSEIESEEKNGEFDNHAPWHAKVNRAIEAYANDKERIVIINPTEYIHSQEDFAGCTNHYSRNVYYSMAKRISELTK